MVEAASGITGRPKYPTVPDREVDVVITSQLQILIDIFIMGATAKRISEMLGVH